MSHTPDTHAIPHNSRQPLPGFIGERIQRANRHLLKVSLIIIAFAVPAAVAGIWFFFHLLNKPIETIHIHQLQARLQNPGNEFFRLDFGDGKFLPSFRIHQDTVKFAGSEIRVQYCHLLKLEGATLAVKTPYPYPPQKLTGNFVDFTNASYGWHDAQRTVATSGAKPLASVLFQDGEPKHDEDLGAAAIISSMAVLASLIMIVVVVGRKKGFLRHPIIRKLHAFGPPQKVASMIDAEFQAGHDAFDDLHITRSWLIRFTSHGLDLIHMADVVWAYGSQGRRSSECTITVHDNRKHMINTVLPREDVEKILDIVAHRIPWATIGCDPQRMDYWTRNQDEFLADVAQRKRHVQSDIREWGHPL